MSDGLVLFKDLLTSPRFPVVLPTAPSGPIIMTNGPLVSVLMPVYNAGRYVAQAVESILDQSLGDFEFLIVDDGSTDGSRAILERYAARDERIRFVSRPNAGLVATLNEMLGRARGEFIARMDADDAALPHRLEVQVRYLRQHPECLAVGGMVLTIDSDGDPIAPWNLPTTHEEIDGSNLRGHQAMVHPTLLARRDAMIAVGGYREERFTCDDLDLFLRLAERGRLANVPDILLKYRRHSLSVSHARMAQSAVIRRLTIADARLRRGLGGLPAGSEAGQPELSIPAQHRSWAWAALGAGFASIVRKHAFSSLRRSPLALESWRVVYCALRGY